MPIYSNISYIKYISSIRLQNDKNKMREKRKQKRERNRAPNSWVENRKREKKEKKR